MFFLNLIKYYFAFKTRLKISDQKLLNFAECIAGKGKFCGRNAAASCAKNYGDSQVANGSGSTRTVQPLKQSEMEEEECTSNGQMGHQRAKQFPPDSSLQITGQRLQS